MELDTDFSNTPKTVNLSQYFKFLFGNRDSNLKKNIVLFGNTDISKLGKKSNDLCY